MVGLIAGAVGAIGTIVSAAVTVTKALAVVGLAVNGLKALGNALMGIAKAVGLIQPEMNVEDLGDKALQAEEEGIKPENFNSYAEYVKAVEGFKVDPEKSKQLTEEEKVKKGIELTTGVTVERFEGFPIEEFFTYAGKNPEYFTEAKMKELGKLMEVDGKYVSDVLNYMNGTEKNDFSLGKTIDTLTKIEKKVNPNISDDDALDIVLNIRK